MQDEILLKFICEKSTRLDLALFEASKSMQISRNSISCAIKAGLVKINEQLQTKPSKIVQIGDNIVLLKVKTTPTCRANVSHKLFNKIEIIYEDDDILVISKPSGLIMHEATSHKEPTLVDFLKQSGRELATIGGEFRAGIVHRLDKLTSGVIVVAKNNIASANLSQQLKQKSAHRIYLALIDLPLKQNCIINKAIGRCKNNRIKKAIYPNDYSGAKSAKSAFCNILLDEISTKYDATQQTQKNANLIAAKLFTGRTHQIRAHLASINRHILGDVLYGFKGFCDRMERIFLHSFILELTHPKTGVRMRFKSSLPDEFGQILNKETLNEKLSEEFIISCFDDVDKWLLIE